MGTSVEGPDESGRAGSCPGDWGRRVCGLQGRRAVGRVRVVGSRRGRGAKRTFGAPVVTVRRRVRRRGLADRASVEQSLHGVSHVVHLAAVRSQSSDSNPRLSHEVNVDATYDLFAGAARHGSPGRLWLLAHRDGGFADPHGYPFREAETGGTGRDLSFYAATKLAAEAYLEAFAGGEVPGICTAPRHDLWSEGQRGVQQRNHARRPASP